MTLKNEHQCDACGDTGLAINDLPDGSRAVFRCDCPKGDGEVIWYAPGDKKQERPIRVKRMGEEKPQPRPLAGRDRAAGEHEEET